MSFKAIASDPEVISVGDPFSSDDNVLSIPIIPQVFAAGVPEIYVTVSSKLTSQEERVSISFFKLNLIGGGGAVKNLQLVNKNVYFPWFLQDFVGQETTVVFLTALSDQLQIKLYL